jgi:hypothetical protein
MVALMEIEQADMAVHPMEAAPVDGAENERELTMSSILSRMTQPEEKEPDLIAQVPEETETPGEEETDDTPAEADTPDARKAKNFRGRWDHLDEQERRVVELTAKRGLSLNEAYRAVYGDAVSIPRQSDASDRTVADLDEKISGQQRRLDELKSRKAAAQGDLAEYDAASEAYLEARETLRDLRQQRQQTLEQQAAETLQARRKTEAEAQAALAEDFPDALTPGTELYEACREELNYLRESNSPLIQDPQAPYKVARRLARTLGIQKASTSPAASIMPRRSVRPVPAGGTPVEAPAAVLERRLAGARSQGAMLELMREIGTPFEALMQKG